MARTRVVAAFIGLVAAASVVAVLGSIGIGPMIGAFHHSTPRDAHGGVVRLEHYPVPEGPVPPAFGRPTRSDARTLPLDLVHQYIPDPLPAPLFQGWMCRSGGDTVVIFADGYKVTYGPCKAPPSIERLWEQMVVAIRGEAVN